MAASRRTPLTEMQSMHREFSLPEAPRDFDDAYKAYSCQILVYYRHDPRCIAMSTIHDELSGLPYVNDLFAQQLRSSSVQFTHPFRVGIVYIEDFFTDGRDFAFYVIGETHFTKFLAGMYSFQPYDGPLIATPIIFGDADTLDCNVRRTKSLSQDGLPEVVKSHGTEWIRWRHLFMTARLAWERLRFDGKKVIKARLYIARRLQKGIDELAAQAREHQEASDNAGMSEKKRGKMKDPGPSGNSRALRKDPGPSGDSQALQKDPALLALAISQAWEMFKEGHATLGEVEDYLERIQGQYVSATDAERGEEAIEIIGLLSDTFGMEHELESAIEEADDECIAELNDNKATVIEDRINHIQQLVVILLRLQTTDSKAAVTKETNAHTMLDQVLSFQHSGSQGGRSEDMRPHSPVSMAAAAYEKEMKDLSSLTDEQRTKLASFMSFTTRRERESARFLARFSWDIEFALEAYFRPGVDFEEDANSDDGHNADTEDEDLATAIQLSMEDSSPRDDTPVVHPRESATGPSHTPNGVSKIPQRRTPWTHIPPRVGPSCWTRDAEPEDVDEATLLDADRRRLAAIIVSVKKLDDGHDSMFKENNADVKDLAVTSEDLISPTSPPDASLDHGEDMGAQHIENLEQGLKAEAEGTRSPTTPKTTLNKRYSDDETSPPKRPCLGLRPPRLVLRPPTSSSAPIQHPQPTKPPGPSRLTLQSGINSPFPPRHLPPRPKAKYQSHSMNASAASPRRDARSSPSQTGSAQNVSTFGDWLENQGAVHAPNESTSSSATVSTNHPDVNMTDDGGDALAGIRNQMFQNPRAERERRDSMGGTGSKDSSTDETQDEGVSFVSQGGAEAGAQNDGGAALAAFQEGMFKELGVEERRDSGSAEGAEDQDADEVMEDWDGDGDDADDQFDWEEDDDVKYDPADLLEE